MCVDDEVTLPVKEEDTVVLKTNRLGLPDCTEIDPDVTPPAIECLTLRWELGTIQ